MKNSQIMSGVMPYAAQQPLRSSGLSLLTRIVATLSEWLRAEREARRLSALDDHMLKDIGIARSDISRAVRDGRDS